MKVTRCILPSVKNEDESDCAMFDAAGKQVRFKVKHGILEIPKDSPDHDYMLRTVTANGFVMIDVVDVDDPKPSKKKGKNGGKVFNPMIRLEHPDQAPSNDITTSMEITSSESPRPAKIEIEHGIVETEIPWVVNALIDRGFRVLNPFDLERQMRID